MGNNETYINLNEEFIRVGLNLFRVGPLMFYLKFATAIFVKLLLAPQHNFVQRSATYQRLTLRIIFVCSLLLSMLIWLVETEFMGFFLKYVLVINAICNKPKSPLNIAILFQKSPPSFWIFPSKFITESFVALKLFVLNLLINKYETLAEDTASDVTAGLLLGSVELSRIEDMILEFFENCELGRCGYLLLNPIRERTEKVLVLFQYFVNGHDVKAAIRKKKEFAPKAVTIDDLTLSKTYQYKTMNAKRSHSANCILDFKKLIGHS